MSPLQLVDNTERPTSVTALGHCCCRWDNSLQQFHQLSLSWYGIDAMKFASDMECHKFLCDSWASSLNYRLLYSVLFFSHPRLKGWPHHGRNFSIYLCPLSFWLTLPLINFSMESPVHVLMLFIQAVCGLPHLCAPGIVPCIISFFRQLPCFLMVWP